MLTIHFWQWPLLRQPSGQNICSHVTLNGSPPPRKLFLLVLYGPAGKWKQMSSTREQLIHCYGELPLRLLTCLREKCIARQLFSFASLLLLCCSIVAVTFSDTKWWVCTSLLLTLCHPVVALKMGPNEFLGPKFGHQGSHKGKQYFCYILIFVPCNQCNCEMITHTTYGDDRYNAFFY